MHRSGNGCYQRHCSESNNSFFYLFQIVFILSVMYDGGFQVAGIHPDCMCSTKLVRATIHAFVPETVCHVKQPVDEVEGRGESFRGNDEVTQTQIGSSRMTTTENGNDMECCPCKDKDQSTRSVVEDGMNNIYENKNYDEGTSTGSLQMQVRTMCDCSRVNCPNRRNRNGGGTTATDIDRRGESRSMHQQSTSQVYADERRNGLPTERVCYSVCKTPFSSRHSEIHQQFVSQKGRQQRSRASPPSMRDVGLNYDPEDDDFLSKRRTGFSSTRSNIRMQDTHTNTSAIFRNTCCQQSKCGCYEAAMQIAAGYAPPPPPPSNGKRKRNQNMMDEDDDFYYDDRAPYEDYRRPQQQVSIVQTPSFRQVYQEDEGGPPYLDPEEDWWLEQEMKKKEKKEKKKQQKKQKKGGCVIL
ncbi:PREDICTED: uncharacterized protein LOC108556657 isoform X2 [Nicrophorus vespilloides]|uniref:Uncharacterized protein LOC108556657 isoform X2 n=1 Tax=Nicrophorus vespilloides TaxID=110193 RepID=A0ABM1M195_NICVS|nr:PREDICTED: uncharacterized protein LOC108556657 isoform X2 [Nicrophorus vespilloides]